MTMTNSNDDAPTTGPIKVVTMWDDERQPRKLSVMVKTSYFKLLKKERKKCRKEVRLIVESWLNDL
jgi:hypothetical protein